MLLKNLDMEGGPNASKQLVNGSRGVVVGMVPIAECIKELEDERVQKGGGDIARLTRMDPKAAKEVSQLQRQLDTLKRCVWVCVYVYVYVGRYVGRRACV